MCSGGCGLLTLISLLYLIPVSLFIVFFRAATDHNIDNTTAILREWLTVMQTQYHYIEWRPSDKPTWDDHHTTWTYGRYYVQLKLHCWKCIFVCFWNLVATLKLELVYFFCTGPMQVSWGLSTGLTAAMSMLWSSNRQCWTFPRNAGLTTFWYDPVRAYTPQFLITHAQMSIKKIKPGQILQSEWRFRSYGVHKCELCWNALKLFLLISCQCVLYLLISWLFNYIIRIVIIRTLVRCQSLCFFLIYSIQTQTTFWPTRTHCIYWWRRTSQSLPPCWTHSQRTPTTGVVSLHRYSAMNLQFGSVYECVYLCMFQQRNEW